MNDCKSCRQQIALLSVQALSEKDASDLTDHLNRCAACRAYASQLQEIVRLYASDAERSVDTEHVSFAPAASRHRAERVRWLAPVPAFALLALALLYAALLLSRKPSPEHSAVSTRRMASLPIGAAPAVPSIGNSRHLADKDLDELIKPESSHDHRSRDFVFSVGTRDDGP